MSSDPGNGYGDSGDDDLEERKTRVVQRSDIVDRSAPGREAATEEATTEEAKIQEAAAAPAGTIIGRTRLMSGHGQSPEGGGVQGVTPTMKMGQPKTQYIHGAGVESDPVAGWVVVVKGPGKGNFCRRLRRHELRRPRCQPARQPELRRRFHLARGARLHHLR